MGQEEIVNLMMCLAAGLFLQNHPNVAATKIGLWGGSYGGYLTAMGLARASDMFAAGVDIHGVMDWNVIIKNFMPSYEASGALRFCETGLRFKSNCLYGHLAFSRITHSWR